MSNWRLGLQLGGHSLDKMKRTLNQVTSDGAVKEGGHWSEIKELKKILIISNHLGLIVFI